MAITYLNGHPKEDVTDPEGETLERIWASVPKEVVAQVNDYFYSKRLKSRSAAVADLIQLGLIHARGQGRN
jgi:metal-responsive CopG/Arc/MetJ family transcriptional regulator